MSGGDRVSEQVYEKLKRMCTGFAFKPGERINEGELAKALGVSRTPLRETLSRLYAESLLDFTPGKGFFNRHLDIQEVFSLYEARKAVEREGLRLAAERAQPADFEALVAFLEKTGPEPGDRSVDDLVELDEAFHEGLMRLSGNAVLLQILQNLNARIRVVRWVDMEQGDRASTQQDHMLILQALLAGNVQEGLDVLDRHISRRRDQIATALKESYAHTYMNGR